MQLVFQRPLWLEFTAFASAMLGFVGHFLGLWRMSLGLGVTLKVTVLEGLVHVCSKFLGDDSWLMRSLKETLYVFKSFLSTPEWFQFWYYFSGILEFVASTALFFVGIFLWHKKTYAVRLFYIVIGFSIAIHAMSILASLFASEGLGIMKLMLDMPLLLIKAALIPVVYFADKTVLGTHAKQEVEFELGPRGEALR